jgi:hypothetical protein
MSLNATPVEVSLLEDPLVALNNKRSYGVVKGGQTVTWQSYPSTSFTSSGSQITISCNPPSRDIIIDRRVFLSCSFTVTFTGTGNPLLNLGTTDGLRAYPLASVINSIGFQIGNTNVTAAPLYQYWPALSRYHNSQDSQDRNYSMTPAYPDQYQQYSDWKSLGSGRNPLALQGENPAVNPRGGFPVTVVSNGNGTAQVTFTVTEPILMSPFLFAKDDTESGLTGIQNMNFVCTLQNLERLWSHDSTNGNSITNYAVTLNSASLLFKYITPAQGFEPPKAISWPYFNVVSYPTTTSNAITSGSAVSIVQNTVQLDGIPRRLYVYVRQQDSDLKASSSDSYFGITGMTVQFNNSIYLSSANQQQLYDMSVKNGLQMSWPQFSKYCGSVVCMNLGEDIGLQPNEAPGVAGQYNLTITVNATNLASSSITPALFVVAIYEGTFSVVNGSTSHMLNVLSKNDVLNAKMVQGIHFKRAEHVYGGDIFSSIWSGMKSAFDKVKPVLSVIKPAAQLLSNIPHPYAQSASSGLSALSKLTGSAMRKKGMRGRGFAPESKEEPEYKPLEEDGSDEGSEDECDDEPKSNFSSIYANYKQSNSPLNRLK